MFKRFGISALALGAVMALLPVKARADDDDYRNRRDRGYYSNGYDNRYGNRYANPYQYGDRYNDRSYREGDRHERREWREHERHEQQEWRERAYRNQYRSGYYDAFGYWHPYEVYAPYGYR